MAEWVRHIVVPFTKAYSLGDRSSKWQPVWNHRGSERSFTQVVAVAISGNLFTDEELDVIIPFLRTSTAFFIMARAEGWVVDEPDQVSQGTGDQPSTAAPRQSTEPRAATATAGPSNQDARDATAAEQHAMPYYLSETQGLTATAGSDEALPLAPQAPVPPFFYPTDTASPSYQDDAPWRAATSSPSGQASGWQQRREGDDGSKRAATSSPPGQPPSRQQRR
jgi:hypothetical protein